MAKAKTIYVCQQCGAHSASLLGRCPHCGAFGSYQEEILQKESGGGTRVKKSGENKPRKIADISIEDTRRIDLHDAEFNRVLGGGLVPGSLVLLGGEPGIGKSTLALQVALRLKDKKCLYISGEESPGQIKYRAGRLSKNFNESYIFSETVLERIFPELDLMQPDLLIVDSIQTMMTSSIDSSPGTISQIRECTYRLLEYAKENHLPVILIGHITKDGHLAGPKALEHIVDTVLQFEGDQNHIFRILRSNKNRFGSTSELGIYEMRQEGLVEVSNPSDLLISQANEHLSGSAISASIEGVRPILIETQALVSSAVYGTPQRSSTGFDIRRLNMLLAVLEKRAGFHLASKDVFLNIAGGLRVNDPAIDLAVVASVLSSSLDISLSKKVCFAGEIGLSGEIRPVTRIEQRISEASKLGFDTLFLSGHSAKGIHQKDVKMQLRFVSKMEDLTRELFK